ncbi:MAG: insulinase family protein, partial [Clostridia bacterium]|nr:insulinase family protein [Clostridia bacterium]
MYNSILGCGIFSKLFNNVREKLSLCYYASSSVDYLKGIMFINSGIEVSNFQKAYDEILVQMEDIKNGEISDVEFSAALLGTVNSINSTSDNPFVLDDYYLGKIISGKIVTLDELAEGIKKVTKEDVIKVAQKIQLDTVYFLKGCEN